MSLYHHRWREVNRCAEQASRTPKGTTLRYQTRTRFHGSGYARLHNTARKKKNRVDVLVEGTACARSLCCQAPLQRSSQLAASCRADCRVCRACMAMHHAYPRHNALALPSARGLYTPTHLVAVLVSGVPAPTYLVSQDRGVQVTLVEGFTRQGFTRRPRFIPHSKREISDAKHTWGAPLRPDSFPYGPRTPRNHVPWCKRSPKGHLKSKRPRTPRIHVPCCERSPKGRL